MIIIGHRGAMGYEPENTLRSLKTAIEHGVDMVEFDVHLLKSGELILMHDNTLDRTTNGHGFVSDKTYDEIKKLDAGLGEKVPTLREALDVIDRRVPVIIEITGFLNCAKEVSEVINEYVQEKNWRYEDFSVASFIQHELDSFKKLLPAVKLGVNISAIPITYAKFTEDLEVDFVASEDLYLRDEGFVKDAQSRGLKFFIYSVNDPDYLPRYQQMGIDGIYTNTPNQLIEKYAQSTR